MSSETKNAPSRRRLAAAVAARMDELALTQTQVHANGGPSTTTLTKILSARPPDPGPNTFSKLDTGLKWAPGSARKIYRDGTPPSLRVRLSGTDVAEIAEMQALTLNPALADFTTEELLEEARLRVTLMATRLEAAGVRSLVYRRHGGGVEGFSAPPSGRQ